MDEGNGNQEGELGRMTIDRELHKLLRRVEKPARYTEEKSNSVIKDPADVSVRVGFAFPDTYEIGMSYLGMQILYDILNKNDDIYCERVFAPAEDMEQLMRENGRELFTLETLTPVKGDGYSRLHSSVRAFVHEYTQYARAGRHTAAERQKGARDTP